MITYQHRGELHWLPEEELRAVERSGHSSWQEYMSTPTKWPEPTVAVVPLMEARPGAVEPGLRPIEHMYTCTRVAPFTPLEYAFVRHFRRLPNSTLAALLGRRRDAVRDARKRLKVPSFKVGAMHPTKEDELMRMATFWLSERRAAYGYD